MAVSFVASSSQVSGSASTTVASPAGTQVGDLLLALHQQEGVGTTYAASTPAGWTLIGEVVVNGTRPRLFARTVTDAAASYTFTSAGGSDRNVTLLAYRGDAGSPSVGLSALTSNNDSGTTFVPSALISPVSAGTFVVTATVAWWDGPIGVSAGFNVNASYAGAAAVTIGSLIVDKTETVAGTASAPTFTSTYGNSRYWGAFQVSLNDNTAPNAPILLAPADASTLDRNVSQRFDWDFSDPDAGDSQSAYNFRYRATGAATWVETGWTGVPQTYHDVAGGTFLDATSYEWQVATKDAQGVEGPFSASSFFTASTSSAPATITYPASGGTVNQTDRVDWSTPTQESYQVRRLADNAGTADTATVYYDSGEVVSTTARTHALDFATNNRYEHVQVRIKDGGLWSAWSSVRVMVSYTPPPTPTLTPAADDAAGAVVVTYSTPTPGTGEPTPEYADIEVRDTTGRDRHRPAEGVRVATLQTPSGTFIDWLPAAGINYEYRVTAVDDNGTTSASAWTPIDADALASVYHGGGY